MHRHICDLERDQAGSAPRARQQLPHAVVVGWLLDELQALQTLELPAKLAQQRQIVGEEVAEVVADAGDLHRLAQLLAARLAQLEAQRCGRRVVSLQLLLQRPRRLPQLIVDAAEGHGDYGLPVICPCNYSPVITGVITCNYSPPFPVTSNW